MTPQDTTPLIDALAEATLLDEAAQGEGDS